MRSTKVCPACGSASIRYRNGRNGATWRYYCNSCGDRFTEPDIREIPDKGPARGPAAELWRRAQQQAEVEDS